MSDEKDRLAVRGLAALKIMLDERTARITNAETRQQALSDRIARLEQRVDSVKEEVTGKHDLHQEIGKVKGKEEAAKEIKAAKAARQQQQIDKWKSTAPVYIAIVTAFGALVTGIINLILHMLGGGGGGH